MCMYNNCLLKNHSVNHLFLYRKDLRREYTIIYINGVLPFFIKIKFTTFSDGCLGSRNDEERSEMRYVMRIAEFSESSNF